MLTLLHGGGSGCSADRSALTEWQRIELAYRKDDRSVHMFRHFLDLQSASSLSRLTRDSVKAPPWVLVPIRTVGLTLRTTSSSPLSSLPQSSSSRLNSCSISSLTLSPREVLMRPCWSINQNLDAAVDSSTLDSSWMASRSWRAMPSPADPAPNMTIRWS